MGRCSGLFTKFTTADLKFFIVYLISYKILAILYTVTLQGGDVKWILDRLALFGVIIIFTVIFALLLTTLAISRFPQVKIITKILSLFFGWWIFLDTALEEMNTTLLSHGQYNFLMFALLYILGFIIYIIITSCNFIRTKITPCQFWGGIILFAVFFSIIWIELSRKAQEGWNKGISGVNMEYKWEGCDIKLPGTPWAEIIPDKTFNFFFSSECPIIEKFSSLEDNILTIKCDKDAEIVELPDFLSAHTDEFVLEENGLSNWKNTSKSLEKRYKVPGKSIMPIYSEYFQVFCNGDENFFTQNIVNEKVKEKNKTYKQPRMNLLMFQIDTLSRSHFIRRMTETISVLEELNKTKEFEVFQTFRLATIGFNTEINTKALYTGSQYRQTRSGRPIWEIFSNQNNAVLYLNGFCEDWSSRFLKKMPSGMDYLLFKPWCHPEYTPVNRTFSNFDGVNSIRRRCINGEYVHKRVFSYLKEFWNNHKDYGKMVLAPMQESHEASMDVISTLDPDMAKLINWYKDSGELNNTIIIITSDHGNHMSLYYIFSEIGKLEHKMPELFMIFPHWFLEKYPHIRNNMKNNEQRLITHYDTHWAIVSLSQLPEFGGNLETTEKNQYSHIWDCRKNEKYIKDIWYFKDKAFYNTDALLNFDDTLQKVFMKIERFCLGKYSDIKPSSDPMNHDIKKYKNIEYQNIPPCESENCYDVTVVDVIKDINSYFWLLDALTDIQERNFQQNEEQVDLVNEYSQDLRVFHEFQAPRNGRYKLGKSLFHYWENKTCEDTGTLEWCPCS